MAEHAFPAAAKELLARLPRTFRPALNDHLRQWDLLFPAERRVLEGQLGWLGALPGNELKRLFAPIVELEARMELPPWTSDAAGMTVRDVGILTRSPLYPRWRSEVEKVFAHIDSALSPSAAARVPRLVLCVLPAGLPNASQPLWPELAQTGAWAQLDKPFGSMLSALVFSLARRRSAPVLEDIERTWVLECDTRFSPLSEETSTTVLSWTALAAIRREFLKRLNTIGRDLRAVDQATDELRRAGIAHLLSRPTGASPRVREFVRSLLLSGNGALVFNNSFVQWGASEALRRIQPQVLVASFGIRPTIKPFSGAVLFEDQNKSNPVPDEDDPAGSLTDALILARYVSLAAERVTAFQNRTLTMMAACDLDRVLVLGTQAPAPASGRLSADELTAFTLQWLARDSV